MQAIVVSLDRLATRLLGCYGNEWIETPHLDRLASRAVVFDQAYAADVGTGLGRAWRTAHHAGQGPSAVFERLRQAGVATYGVAAESALAGDVVTACSQVQRTGGRSGLDAAPDSVPIARLIQAGKRVLQQTAGSRRLLWLHAPEPELPPEGFATLYFEDFAERGLPLDELPRADWAGQLAVLAGSVSLIDHWIGELVAALEAQSEPTLLIVTAAAGQPTLADYRRAAQIRPGVPTETLAADSVQCPLILASLGGCRAEGIQGIRCSHLVQPMDVLSTLLDWFEVLDPDSSADLAGRSLLRECVAPQPSRARVFYRDGDHRAGIQTADWKCLVEQPAAEVPERDVQIGDLDWPAQVQLFSKPEDTWDVTDLASQQPEICQDLVRELNRFRRSFRASPGVP